MVTNASRTAAAFLPSPGAEMVCWRFVIVNPQWIVAAFLLGTTAVISLVRMAYEIVLAPEALDDLRVMKANLRAAVRSAIEIHLRHEPAKVSRSRIKRLRGLRRPQYRLRIGATRVFYDITGSTVEILAIVTKSQAEEWLKKFGDAG